MGGINGQKWSKMTKMLKNAKNCVFFSQKILIIDLVHSVGMYRHEFGRKTASGRDWALGRDPKRPKIA